MLLDVAAFDPVLHMVVVWSAHLTWLLLWDEVDERPVLAVTQPMADVSLIVTAGAAG